MEWLSDTSSVMSRNPPLTNEVLNAKGFFMPRMINYINYKN